MEVSRLLGQGIQSEWLKGLEIVISIGGKTEVITLWMRKEKRKETDGLEQNINQKTQVATWVVHLDTSIDLGNFHRSSM
ncbi:hypothetical protein TNIN_431981 [Trichonephila inaurata madagascariensis]|uniref:Uncharacterized protein n=1 Tax=Trichonephila inaurata madagascariensis TaxID=2747483 RepID=A0A8X6XZ52_9ARAC|nr:hypothetical protein TNIN_431981 [Trichonephila inaurata madagascariensis]